MAHWIIEDKGFGGVVYKCSNCGESWNEYYSKFPKDHCVYCREDIDEDADEYIEDTYSSALDVKLQIDTRTKELQEAVEFLCNFSSYSEYQKNLIIVLDALDFAMVRVDSLKESLDVLAKQVLHKF